MISKMFRRRKSMQMKLYLLTLFIVILLLSACSSEPKTPTVNPTEGAQMLAGTYTTTITAEDITNTVASQDPALQNNQGLWKVVLTDDGLLEVTLEGDFMARGDYAVEGDRIKVALVTVCDDCDCSGAIGRYVWGLNGDQLAFAKVAGSCDAMDIVLTAHPLTRQ